MRVMNTQTHFKPYQPNQLLLLPPDMRQWLPEDDLSYFIMDVVNELDLSAIGACVRDSASQTGCCYRSKNFRKVCRSRNPHGYPDVRALPGEEGQRLSLGGSLPS